MDNLFGTSFFLPTGLAVGGRLADVSGGGSPLLWQHLFWFLGHPEVYVLILPAMGIVCEIIANNTRKPIWGYKSLVFSALAIGFLSFIWAHHMYLTAGRRLHVLPDYHDDHLDPRDHLDLSSALGVPSGHTPMLFALAFLPMFGIGGLTGLPLGFNYSDIPLHDTYYVIGHFHYVVAPGTIFAIFAGIYHWYPKVTGRFLNEFWGRVHFVLSLIFMNLVFLPMFVQGLKACPGDGRRRRATPVRSFYGWPLAEAERGDLARGSLSARHLHHQSRVSSAETRQSDNLGLDHARWRLTPPLHGNSVAPWSSRPCEYSRPGQRLQPAESAGLRPMSSPSMRSSHCRGPPDTGLFNAKVGIWLFPLPGRAVRASSRTSCLRA
jgi:hypothetical protein